MNDIKNKNPILLYELVVTFMEPIIEELIEERNNPSYDGYATIDMIEGKLTILDEQMSTLLKEKNIKSIKTLKPNDSFRQLIKRYEDEDIFGQYNNALENCKPILWPEKCKYKSVKKTHRSTLIAQL